MKLRIPDGCGAVSHLGQNVSIAEDGSIEIDDDALPVLVSHGFRPWADDREPPDIAEMTREQLVAVATDATFKALQTVDTEEIRTRLIACEASGQPIEQTPDAAPATDISAQTLSALNRQGLFAFLKSKGVSVSLPVTNDGLRALARQAIGLT